jgi:hypothetical protein
MNKHSHTKPQSKSLKFDKSAFISYKTGSISKEYTIGKTLGSGSFGTVRSASSVKQIKTKKNYFSK